MKKFLFIILYLLSFKIFSYGQITKNLGLTDDRITTKTKVVSSSLTYSYGCYISDLIAQIAYNGWVAEELAVDLAPEKISNSEEVEFGNDMYNEMLNNKTYTFITSGNKYEALNDLLDILVACRPSKKTSLTYTIHLLSDDKTVNAYTAGAHIYVTTAMIDYCETVSELASIIAHEIGHNEEGDLRRTLVRYKSAGELGDVALVMKNILTLSWNQFNEHRADCYGVNLAQAAGYEPCATVLLWKRMAEDYEEKPTIFGKLFRTHPYSSDRAKCVKEHIKKNFSVECD